MSNNTTFWKFLENNYIEIPIIQRDYAQGRKGKEELRKTFLGNLKNALDKNQKLTLDFVYGSTSENNRLNPLDGQQRLTTLWLLHWYMAYKAGKLDVSDKENSESNKKIVATFNKFTYETRVSSREFCEKLAEFSTQEPIDFTGTISDFIQQQTWFYSAWKQDPTIQSMLRMLSGTPKKDKNGQEIVDGLEELFVNLTKTFDDYWKLLSGEDCPIKFYNLDLGKLELTDDLYIKMNARGEQLTSFENFKADLVGYIKEQQKEANDTDKEQWEKLLSPTDGIPIKMDTTWTDIFWKNKTTDGKIDDIYFAFLNRFFLNEFICQKKDGNYTKTANKIQPKNKEDDTQNDPTFNLLNGEKPYQSFEKYKACITKESLESLLKTLNNFEKSVGNKKLEGVNELFKENWRKEEIKRRDEEIKELEKKIADEDEKKEENKKTLQEKSNKLKELKEDIIYYIPAYKDKSITTLTQPQRVVFYAICKYFELGAYDESSLKRWMRVVWNLVENDSAGWIGCLRLIDELSKNSHDIYKFLAEEKSTIKSKANNEQIKEEREKAKQILYSQEGSMLPEKPESWANSSNSWDWEQAIITAEKYAFFKGSIRFLIRNEKGEYGWDDFDTKWKNAQKYFDKDLNYKNDSILLRNLISHFDEWEQFWKFSYDNSNGTWKTLLLERKWSGPVHILLTGEKNSIENKNENQSFFKTDFKDYEASTDDKIWKQVQEELVKTNLLDNIVKQCVLNDRYANYVLYPYNAKADKNKYVLANPRNEILSKALKDNKITTDQKVKNCDFFWGWDIDFTYSNYSFRWESNNNIYLMDMQNNKNYQINDENKKIKVSATTVTSDNFLDTLNDLIEKGKK